MDDKRVQHDMEAHRDKKGEEQAQKDFAAFAGEVMSKTPQQALAAGLRDSLKRWADETVARLETLVLQAKQAAKEIEEETTLARAGDRAEAFVQTLVWGVANADIARPGRIMATALRSREREDDKAP